MQKILTMQLVNLMGRKELEKTLKNQLFLSLQLFIQLMISLAQALCHY